MKISFRIFNVIAMGLFAGFACAEQCPPAPQTPTPEIIQQLKAVAKNRGFLWEISKDNHTSWLYGTLHVGKLDWAFPGPIIVDALRKSGAIVMELDLSDSVTMAKLGELSRQDAGKIPESLKPRFKKLLTSVCLPETLIDSSNPVILLSWIELFEARFDGLEAGYGVESILAGYAHGAKKKIVALETAEAQMAVLLGPAGEVPVNEIEEALQLIESGKSKSTTQHLSRMWSQSDFNDLQRYTEWCDCMDTEDKRAAMARLVDERNAPMADEIDVLHAQGQSVFVAVGSLHMIGDKGLPALLKRKGYEVKPILFE